MAGYAASEAAKQAGMPAYNKLVQKHGGDVEAAAKEWREREGVR